MKTLLLATVLLSLAGCGVVGELMSNAQQTNAKMEETVVVMTAVRETVLDNRAGVERSTAEQKRFQKVNQSNMEIVKKLKGETHIDTIAPLAGIGLLLLLFLPCLILGLYYFQLPRKK